jgi:hypothetical protein
MTTQPVLSGRKEHTSDWCKRASQVQIRLLAVHTMHVWHTWLPQRFACQRTVAGTRLEASGSVPVDT